MRIKAKQPKKNKPEMKMPFKTLAIDNSSKNIGWSFFYDGKLHDFNDIQLKGVRSDDRLEEYFYAMNKLLNLWYPDIVVIESPFTNPRFIRSSAVLYEYFGILKLLCKRQNLKYTTITPTGVKKGMCGKGNVTKEKVAEAAKKEYGLPQHLVLSSDTTDAIALGHTFLLTKPYEL